MARRLISSRGTSRNSQTGVSRRLADAPVVRLTLAPLARATLGLVQENAVVDRPRRGRRAVGQLTRNVELPDRADVHLLKAFAPARDDLIEAEGRRLTALDR